MISLAKQIRQAAGQARREAIQRVNEARAKAERQAEIRAKQWASRKAGGNGVASAVTACLPTTKETAIDLDAIKTKLQHLDVQDSSISGAISTLYKAKQIDRIGERREYRYYIAGGKKS